MFLTNKPYQQCSRCVMDTSDPEITFDDLGHCNHCTQFLNNTSKRSYQGDKSEKQLRLIVEKIKKDGKGKEYDCVLGISGGIDSCYTAYVLKNLGIRTLLVHMDNGWNAKEAVNNIKHVANKLGFDYKSYVLDWEEFRDLQLAFLKASVVEAETPTDIAILGALHRTAAEFNVKYIISGGNFATEGILPHLWHYNAKDTTFLNAIQKQFGTKKLRKFPSFGALDEIYYKFFKGIKMVYLLNYVPFQKKEAMTILEKELSWTYYGGKHYESMFTGFIQSYYLVKKFDLDYRKATLSTQICTGEVSRDEALKQLQSPPYNMEKVVKEIEYISKKLNITTEELNEIINLQGKTYRDYPNNEKMLNLLYSTYKKWFGKNELTSF